MIQSFTDSSIEKVKVKGFYYNTDRLQTGNPVDTWGTLPRGRVTLDQCHPRISTGRSWQLHECLVWTTCLQTWRPQSCSWLFVHWLSYLGLIEKWRINQNKFHRGKLSTFYFKFSENHKVTSHPHTVQTYIHNRFIKKQKLPATLQIVTPKSFITEQEMFVFLTFHNFSESQQDILSNAKLLHKIHKRPKLSNLHS